MTLKPQRIGRFVLHLGLLPLALTALWLRPASAQALGSAPAVPAFNDFVSTLKNGQWNVLRGVYVENILALPIVQQPAGQTMYVSGNAGEITQFNSASQAGNIGLLAHNTLAGAFFQQLTIGQEIRLIYGDGYVRKFIVTQVQRYQALEPENPFSSFRNLDQAETLTAAQMFNRAYSGTQHVTFQTCIAAQGNFSWGRLFVIAEPLQWSLMH